MNPSSGWIQRGACRAALAGLLAVWLGAPAAATNPQLDRADPLPLVPIHAGLDDDVAGRYAEIVRSLDGLPSVLVLPVNLAFNEVLADAAPLRWQLANKIAMAGATGTIAVLYPDIGEPYRSVFTKIIEGVESRARSQVVSIAVGADTDAAMLRNMLKARDCRVVIALGRQGMQAADGLSREFGVVVGGVVAVPEAEARDLAVVSLSPDPSLLFARLKELVPGARRVHVVYDPRQNNWLMRLAREAAREQGLELVAQEARDLKAAVRLYQDILAAADPERDVLWLPQDATTVEEGAVLPMVLKEAWERRLPVFSSSFGHVKRGVLFSLYPDNVGLGKNLAGSALGLLASGEGANRGLMPLKDVQMAVNLRTAKHLGLRLSSEQQRSFDLVFTGQ